ncbi:ribosomal protein L7/L12 [Halovulum sp. GXIMD14793]
MKLIATLIVLACAAYAVYSGNRLAAAMVCLGYALGLLAMLAGQVTVPVTPERLDRLQNSVTKLSDEDYARIADIVQNGHKIEAIKVFREVTGAGLRDAKEAVELMMNTNTEARHA